MAVQRYSRRKRRRQDSSENELHIEEMSPDEMGYDGDVEGIEILQPDQYEDADSGLEDKKTSRRLWPDSDDELAGKLRRLSCDVQGPASRRRDDTERGQKRRSQEVDQDEETPLANRAEIEVSELVDGQPEERPIKRRRKRSEKLLQAHRGARKQVMAAWSDSSDKTDDHEAVMDSSNSATPDVPSTPAAPDDRDHDAMDIG